MPAAVPRGRHAPPLEVRLTLQRRRLHAAAAELFCRTGYADATAESIAREAGMSKATFYEHFSNKEECILALFDEAAVEVARAMGGAAGALLREGTYTDRVRAGVGALLGVVAEHPRTTQTLLVEIIGAGPKAIERRDGMIEAIAGWLHHDNAKAARREGAPAFATPEDAQAVVGGAAELLSRQVRLGRPERLEELAPVIERLLLGVLRDP